MTIRSYWIFSYQIPIQNPFSPFPSKEAWKGVFFRFLFFFGVGIFQHRIHEKIFNTFFINFHLIFIQLNMNLIQLNLNSIEFHFNSIQGACNVIQYFSFNCNLILKKSIHSFIN